MCTGKSKDWRPPSGVREAWKRKLVKANMGKGLAIGKGGRGGSSKPSGGSSATRPTTVAEP